jgi:hypothetical protein
MQSSDAMQPTDVLPADVQSADAMQSSDAMQSADVQPADVQPADAMQSSDVQPADVLPTEALQSSPTPDLSDRSMVSESEQADSAQPTEAADELVRFVSRCCTRFECSKLESGRCRSLQSSQQSALQSSPGQ